MGLEIIQYEVKLKCLGPILGSASADPLIYRKFIIEKQQKLIDELAEVSRDSNKYLGQKQISKEQAQMEVDGIIRRLEEIIGRELTETEKTTLTSEETKAKDRKALIAKLGKSPLTSQGTVFMRDTEGLPILLPHVVKGFMKSAGESICDLQETKKGTFLKSKTYTTSIINRHIAPSPVHFFDEKGNRMDVEKGPDGLPSFYERPLRAKTAQGERVALTASEVIHADHMSFRFRTMVVDNGGSPFTADDIEMIFHHGQISGFGQWRNSGVFGQFEIMSITADRIGG